MRKCVKCNIEKDDADFYRRSNGRFKGRVCKVCESAYQMKRYYDKHDEMMRKGSDYRRRNKNIIKKRAALARSKYNHSDYSAGKMKEYREKITDAYVRVRLRGWGVKNEDITPQMIEEGRIKILLERLKKEVQRGGVKICAKCGLSFPISNFYTKKYQWKGVEKVQRNNYCIQCTNDRTKTYRKHERHSKPKKSSV